MAPAFPRLLVAASGTGGHLFPALATAQRLTGYEIEWLGVRDRLETKLVPQDYPLHIIDIEGFQTRGLGTLRVLVKFISAIFACRRLLRQGKFQGVFTTGGYIAAPAILAARSLALPVVLHESNAMPGKVTRWCSRWCSMVAIGFQRTARYLPPGTQTAFVGTPVREAFLQSAPFELPVPPEAPVIVVVGGSQGAVAVNQLVRQCAPAWFEAGAWVVHLTGENDPDAASLQHPQYIALPFYDRMAGLLQRATLAISRAGAGTLTELAIAGTPAILIPYPYAADDHQAYNGASFVEAGAALMVRQDELTPEQLQHQVLDLLHHPQKLQAMAQEAKSLAVPDSAEQLAGLVRRAMQR